MRMPTDPVCPRKVACLCLQPTDPSSTHNGRERYLWANTASHDEVGDSFPIALECPMQLLSVGSVSMSNALIMGICGDLAPSDPDTLTYIGAFQTR